MPITMKRPAARFSSGGSGDEPAMKKPASVSGSKGHVNELCNQVGDAILESAEYPSEVKKMLVNTLSVSLAVPKEKRHEFQNNAIEMVRMVLDSVKTAAESKLDEAKKKLEATFKDNE